MPYANLGDVKLYYEVYGSELHLEGEKATLKPTMIVLHGGPGLDHTCMVPFFGRCAEFSQVIFFDQRGNGRSQDSNKKNWNLKSWGNDVFRFCEALGIEKPFILGESFGGHVAMQYSILHPNHAGGIILVDTEGEFRMEELLTAYEKKGGKEIRDIAERCFKNPIPENIAAYMQKCLPLCAVNPISNEIFKYCIFKSEVTNHYNQGELLSVNLIPELKNVKSPILYLAGKSSPVHTVESTRKTASAFTSKVEYNAFDNCGLVSIDAKDEAFDLIREFTLKHYNT